MRSFEELLAIAEHRHGGKNSVETRLAHPNSTKVLKSIPDDRWLSGMTRSIFRAGINWDIVDRKWPAFENAFFQFSPDICRSLQEQDLDRIAADPSIVRNKAKVNSVPKNARLVTKLSETHTSCGAFFAAKQSDDFINLIELLKSNGSRLGYATSCYFLRYMGVDGFILNKDTLARLNEEGVVDNMPGTSRSLVPIQSAFDTWRQESGRSFSEISGVLALSVGAI
jgi:3-methyladenine DNA glycosylase Tag